MTLNNKLPLRILSIATVFPSRDQPGLGMFVRSRLFEMSRVAELRVVAPCPLVGYHNPVKVYAGSGRLPLEEDYEGMRIYRPRWFYPPNGGIFSARCLALRLKPFLRKLRKEYPFDIIDTHFGYPDGIAASVLSEEFQVPYSITLRGNEIYFSTLKRFNKALRRSMQQASCTIGVSDELRDLSISLGADARTARTIPNGIDVERFEHRDRQQIRERLGIKRRLIFSVGELVPRKGHDLTIRALRRLRDEGHDVELRIAGNFMGGGTDVTESLHRLVGELGLENHVHFLGWVSPDQLVDWNNAADVFCLPTYTEGWPNAVQEALASGVPVVSTAVAAIPQMVPRDELGILVEPGDATALARALRTALAREWDRAAIAAWGQRRPWSKVGAEVVEFLSEVAAAHATAQEDVGTAEAPGGNVPAAQQP